MSHICGFVLAAGEGRRLRPATLSRPKALVPFCGVPLLELACSVLHEVGMNEIIVNACYQGDRVYEVSRRLKEKYGWDIRVSMESKLLNQGGGLREGIKLVPEADHILVHNVDVIADYDLRKLIDQHLSSHAAVTALLIPGKGPRTVKIDLSGNIVKFRSPSHEGALTFAGVHIFRRDVLDFLDPESEAPDIIDAYQAAIEAGLKVEGVVASHDVYWSDMGTTNEYIRAHGDIMDCALKYHTMLRKAQAVQAQRRFDLELKGVTCTGALGLGTELGVPQGSHLHNVVLWDYTRLPRPLLYADGIFVGDDVPSPKPVNEQRVPDERIYKSLNLRREFCTLEPLKMQGSGRRYMRISYKDQSWVWSAYNPERRENVSFAAIGGFLTSLGVRVPAVKLHLADAFELVSSDLGQDDINKNGVKRMLEPLLYDVVDQIALLHVHGDQAVRLQELPLQKGFTKGLYDWERDYFRNNMLERCLEHPDLWAEAAQDYCELRSLMLREPLVPIHRDLQSKNVMVKDGQAYLIDFQGMRLGSAAYDLGSLLYDPYQCYPAELRQSIWRRYCRAVHDLGGTPPKSHILYSAACQRLMQALGAYGKLWLVDKNPWYRQYIIPGFKMLVEAAAEADQYPGILSMAKKGLALAEERFQSSNG